MVTSRKWAQDAARTIVAKMGSVGAAFDLINTLAAVPGGNQSARETLKLIRKYIVELSGGNHV
jgi:hypothetical protein